MSGVEQSIQFQIQDIAAVKQAFSAALTKSQPARQPDTLWWLVDDSGDIPYENRVKGSNILAIDQNVDNINIASIYSDWFNLQNSYFSQDKPFTGMTIPNVPNVSTVTTLQTAIAQVYRFRVPQYFNDIAIGASSAGVPAQYVFPYPDFELATYSASGTFTLGTVRIDLTKTGPGILGVIPSVDGTTATLSVMGVYPVPPSPPSSPPPPAAPPPIALSVTVPSTSLAGVSVDVGGQALTADYDPATTTPAGQVAVPAGPTTGFAVGYPVVITANKQGDVNNLPVWNSEVAEVVSIAANNASMILRQPTPPGGTPFSNGLRNVYTVAKGAKVYPLFSNVSAVSGTSSADLQIGFFPDWGGGFIDITSILVKETGTSSSGTELANPPSPSTKASLASKSTTSGVATKSTFPTAKLPGD